MSNATSTTIMDATTQTTLNNPDLGTEPESETAISRVDWANPPKINIDFTPPPEGAPNPPSPRARQAAIFDNFTKFSFRDAAGSARKRKGIPTEESPEPVMGNPMQKRPVVSRPTCTHISMVKLYFSQECPIRCTQCGRIPPIGFIYQCEQDKTHPQPRPSLTSNVSSGGSALKKARKLSKEKRRPSNESVPLDMSCLSPSIVSGIKKGQYTPEQIDKLIQQKEHLMNVLAQAHADSAEEMRSKNGPSPKILNQKLSQIDEDGNKISKLSQKARRLSASKATATCDYKVCHTCRPNSREKSFMSFGSVLNGDVTPIEQWDALTMPVIPTKLARNLGLREVPLHLTSSSESGNSSDGLTMAGAITPMGNARSAPWSPPNQPRASASSDGFRASGLRKSLVDLLRMRLGSPSPASAPSSVGGSSASNTPRDSAYNSNVSTPKTEAEEVSAASTYPSQEQVAQLSEQIDELSDMDIFVNANGEFNVELWRRMSEEVLARAAELQLVGPLPAQNGELTNYQQDLAQSVEAENDGDLGTMDKLKLQEEQNELENKLKALKGDASDDGEDGLELEKKFGGLGLRLTEEAAETNSPDMIVKNA